MKVLSLYDGMSCGMLAFLKAGIHVNRYVAYEIDKYAIRTSKHNFPSVEQKGDVFGADFTQYEGFDFVIGGSPCTYWSIAQKNNRETEASGMGWELFSQYVRAIHEAKPKFFVYENNKSMSKQIRASIDEAFGFEAICINSALVSAQNRQRLYWVGKRNEDGTYGKVPVEQPEDLGILLKDVLDNAVAWREKSHGGNLSSFTKQSGQRFMAAEPVNVTEDGKSQTIKAQYYKNSVANFCRYSSTYGASGVAEPVANKTLDRAMPEIVEKYGYLPEMFNAYNRAEITDKAPTLSTGSMVTSSCAVNRLEKIEGYAIACEWDEDGKPIKAVSGADGKTYDVYEVKNGMITIKGKQYPIKLVDGFYIIRKLTVTECMRLQTVPEWYEFPVSNAQAYKVLGNGWTVNVIAHIFTNIKNKE